MAVYLGSEMVSSGGGIGGGSTGGGSTGGGLFKVTITGTANESGGGYTYMSDKTGKEVYDAFMSGMLPYAELISDGEIYFNFIPCMCSSDQYNTEFIGVTAGRNSNTNGKILVSYFYLSVNDYTVSYVAFVLNGTSETNCEAFSTLFD